MSESRFLITTADEQTWPEDKPVLFLGEWCRLYDRRSVWQRLDAEVVPYHWDDRQKLHRDYLHLRDLHEELLREMTAALGDIHGVEHSPRYWRILIGPWLGYFVQMLFDRWAMIERAVNEYDIDGVRVLETRPEDIVPGDMDHFIELFLDDPWNEAIYGQLLESYSSISIERVPNEVKMNGGASREVTSVSLKERLKRGVISVKSRVSGVLKRNDEAFFISTYLPTKEDMRLQWSFGQIPKVWLPFPTPRVSIDWTKRSWRLGRSGHKGFSAIVREMIPKHIPTLYLEGYGELQRRCSSLPWPTKPKFIFTSNAFSSDDIFKAWAAEKVEAGKPLLVGQHGGNYGVALWSFGEEHQCAISDAWLSWGWESEGNKKVRPVGNIKAVGRRMDWNREGCALMVEMAIPRYSYHMYSVPVASQWLDYFEEQSRFVSTLPDDLQGQLLVRLYSSDCGWCQKQRWQDRFPQIRLDDGALPMESLVSKARLYIATYNTTVFLESLGMNIPTIMFWNPAHWELRADAIPYFDALKEVGIFHETPEAAAMKMAEVWGDVSGWWKRAEVQEAREYFCHRYSRTIDDPIHALKKSMTSIVDQRN